MTIPQEYKGRYFYHFTHIDNIESIIKYNGLLSTNLKKANGIDHHNVAIENIQTRRSEMVVSVGPGGNVHDYVPFYLASTNKMLLGLLNRKNIDQPLVVFIAVSIEKILEDKVIFTDASANTSNPPMFYNKPEDLSRLNWELIDSTKWKEGSEQELHLRMAEVLVHQKVPLDWIDSFIVFNDICKEKIESFYEETDLSKPNITYQPFNGRYFYFTKFFFDGRKNETLVRGPQQLYENYIGVVENIVKERKEDSNGNEIFCNVKDAILKIQQNFCIIPELAQIYNLKTDNVMHPQTVDEHTINVVNNLTDTQYFELLNDNEKDIVTLAAYFHDIGKGPKEKWDNGIQKAYPDHPVDAIPMLNRIFIEEFEKITDTDIQKICFLVVYHDLLGDIIGKGRSKKELLNLDFCNDDLNMLAALTEADIRSLGGVWMLDLNRKIDLLLSEVKR